MSLQEKVARYQAENGGHVIAIEGPITAPMLVDLYTQARAAGQKPVVLHDGAPTEVAQRMAARFGITLLDATTMVEPSPAPPARAAQPAPAAQPVRPAPAVPTALAAQPAPFAQPVRPAPAVPPAPSAQPVRPAPAVPPALAAPVAEPLLPAHVELAAPEALCIGLPWDPSSPSPSPTVTVEVTAAEIAALPWHAHAPLEEHVEIIESPVARPRRPEHHPTTDLHPHGATWGLPWPRPVPSLDAVSKSDPAVWNMPARIQSVRDDLEQKIAPAGLKIDVAALKKQLL